MSQKSAARTRSCPQRNERRMREMTAGGGNLNLPVWAEAAAIIILLAMVGVLLFYVRNNEKERQRSREARRKQRGISGGNDVMGTGKDRVIRKHFLFSGRVQGVGFRYQARYAAEPMDITGWVKNLSDGTVEMEAQGRPEDINKMLDAIGKGRWIEIESMEAEIIPCKEGEHGFGVRGW